MLRRTNIGGTQIDYQVQKGATEKRINYTRLTTHKCQI